jgi:hypothetical protein
MTRDMILKAAPILPTSSLPSGSGGGDKFPEATSKLAFVSDFMCRVSQNPKTNRITVERKNFNETAKLYNIYVRSFPNNIVA